MLSDKRALDCEALREKLRAAEAYAEWSRATIATLTRQRDRAVAVADEALYRLDNHGTDLPRLDLRALLNAITKDIESAPTSTPPET